MTSQPAMASVTSPVFWRYRPYFDLSEPVEGAPMAAHGPTLAYRNLDTPNWIGTQHACGERFRASLIRESRVTNHAFATPRQTSPELRTSEWNHLCELVERWSDLSADKQTRLCRLLTILGFHRLILSLVPQGIGGAGGPESAALTLAFCRAFCDYTLRRDYGDTRLPEVFHEILTLAPVPSRLRFTVSMILLTDAAKYKSDLAATNAYRQEAARSADVDLVEPDFADYSSAITVSRFYRGASYVPLLRKDFAQVAAEMTIAEEGAKAAVRHAATEDQAFVAQETLYFVTESRMREAQMAGDIELWLTRARSLVSLGEWNSKAHIEMGEALVASGDLAAAEREFTLASRLGPPGTALSLYLAGQCRERMGDWDGASDAYYRAAAIDSAGVSSCEGLLRAAEHTGEWPLARWAEQRIDKLRSRPAQQTAQ